jgi:orotidine-5'-phosphate decarboxylase
MTDPTQLATATADPGVVDDGLRRRLALALDLDDMVPALRLARELHPWFGVAKVGLELFSAAGPEVVALLLDAGYEVFLDLKLHDIPTTVGRAARVVGAYGASYLTIHAAGGPVMVRAGADNFREGAVAAGLPAPTALAVTVLTSEPDPSPGLLAARVASAVEGGADGVVCAGTDLADVRRLAPRLRIVVPGTRPPGSPTHDQARVTTPSEALAAGADLLVVGRVVTHAPDPVAAAAALVASL